VLVIVGVAASGNRPAGLPAAVSAAVWFDFFWTQPYETLAITTRADIETAVLLLLLGLAVTEIGVRVRRQHAAASREAGFRDGILSAAEAAATGSRRAHSSTGSASSSLSPPMCSVNRVNEGARWRDRRDTRGSGAAAAWAIAHE
jgi:K+-sensing histidine kinase KdpD